MISISCLESKLLNNNNWYGRFQLAPFQKGEGLTVANALRRTLLAEKSNFFITWVDFYNAEIPYSVLTGMRESIFDILLNLKQVIFTSDKILPNNSHFFKIPSNNNFSVQKASWRFFKNHRLNINQKIHQEISKDLTNPPHSGFLVNKQNNIFRSSLNQSHRVTDIILPMTPKKKIHRVPEILKFQNPPRARNQKMKQPYSAKRNLNHNVVRDLNSFWRNHECFKTPNVFCQNQILGKTINSENEISYLLPLKIFRKNIDLRGQFLDTSSSKKMSDSIFLGYICAKGPATIYAKNLKLPKGLKCVDPDQYIATLADDGLFYLRFALTTEIKGLPLSDTSNVSVSINQSIKYNTLRLKTFPKILFNKEIQSGFRYQFGLSILKLKPPGGLNQHHLYNSQIDFFGSYPISLPILSSFKQKRPKKKRHMEPDNYYKQKYPFFSFQASVFKPVKTPTRYDSQREANSSWRQTRASYRQVNKYPYFGHVVEKNTDASRFWNVPKPEGLKQGCFVADRNNKLSLSKNRLNKAVNERKTHFELPKKLYHSRVWPAYGTKNLINEQRLILTNDSIKQFNFQNTSITANIQKTCLLNIQIKHYYYKCGRFDRFLFDLIKPFKPNLKSTYYNKPYLKNSRQVDIFGQALPVVSHFAKKWAGNGDSNWGVLINFQRLFERHKSNSQLLIDCNRNNLKRPVLNSILKKKHLIDKRLNILSLQSNASWRFFKIQSENPNPNIFEGNLSKNRQVDFGFYLASSFERSFKGERVSLLNMFKSVRLKWEKIFKSIKTNSIYDYLQKLHITEATLTCFLFSRPSLKRKISLLGSKLISNIGFQRERLSLSLLKNSRQEDRNAFSFAYNQFPLSGRLIKNTNRQMLRLEYSGEKSTRFHVNDEPKYSDLWVSILKEPYIEKFSKICLSFQCSKNHILYFLKSRQVALQYNNSSNFLSKNFVPKKNILRDLLFKSGSIHTEKSLQGQRQWPSLLNKHIKETKLINKSCISSNKYRFFDSAARRIFTSLRAKPTVSMRQVSYKSIWSALYPFQAPPVVSLQYPLFQKIQNVAKRWGGTQQNKNRLSSSLHMNNKNLRGFIQTPTNKKLVPFLRSAQKNNPLYLGLKNRKTIFNPIGNNSVVLRPIYLNVEQIIYILKQITRFRKNQRINPIFFDSLNRVNNHNHYPLNYEPIFPKVYNCFYKHFLLNNTLLSVKIRPDFIHDKTKMPPRFAAENPHGGHRLALSHVWILGNNFVFKSSSLSTSLQSQVPPMVSHLVPFVPKETGKKKIRQVEQFFFTRFSKYSILKEDYNGLFKRLFFKRNDNQKNKPSTFMKNIDASLLLRDKNEDAVHKNPNDYLSIFRVDYKSNINNLSNQPYNLNMYHSKISFNLRYTYPFKYTIFETLLPFVNFSEKVYSKPKTSNLALSDVFSKNFDYIQYNESFKIYTTLAYTCLKTYETHLSKYRNFNRRYKKKSQIVSFQPTATSELAKSLIEDWLAFQRNNKNHHASLRVLNANYRKSYHEKDSTYPFFIIPNQLPSIFNSTYQWRIMNNPNFNDAFIIVPCNWSLNSAWRLYKSLDLINLFDSLVPPLKKLLYMTLPGNFQNTHEMIFLNSLHSHPIADSSLLFDFPPNKLHWSKTHRVADTNNELSCLRPYVKKNRKVKVVDRQVKFQIDNKNRQVNEESSYSFSKSSFFIPKFKIKRSLKKLAMSFENIYYKNFLWNSRKITLRILTNAILPLVTNRKYSISDFIAKKNPPGEAITLINAGIPRNISYSPKFSASFYQKISWGFKQKTHPCLNFLNTNTWSHKNFDNSVSQISIPFLSTAWRQKRNEAVFESSINRVDWQKPPFYSVRHKNLGTTNFMCSKTYPNFTNENQMETLNPNLSISIPQKFLFDSKFFNTDASSFYNDNMEIINSKAYNQEIQALSNSLQKNEEYLPDLKNKLQTQQFDHSFSESFSSLRSKWRPFLIGSLKHSQEKDFFFGSPFANSMTQNQKLSKNSENELVSYNQVIGSPVSIQDSFSSEKLASLRKNRWISQLIQGSKSQLADFKNVSKKRQVAQIKSPLINNLWSSSFFCRYSLYAISTKSDLFLQNLISLSGLTNQNRDESMFSQASPNDSVESSLLETKQNVAKQWNGTQPKNSEISSNNWTDRSNETEISQTNPSDRIYRENPPGGEFRQVEKMQFQYNQSNTDQFLNVKSSSKSYNKTIQKVLKSQNHKSANYFIRHAMHYNYNWQKAINFAILNRFKSRQLEFNGQTEQNKSNWYKNQLKNHLAVFLQYPKKNIDYASQNSINVLKNQYSIRRLKNHERYFGNPLRRGIKQDGLSFYNNTLSTKSYKDFTTSKSTAWRKANQPILKSWKSIIWTAEADTYFCFCYPLFIENVNLPWPKSKHVFSAPKYWLNRITQDLKLSRSTYLSKTHRVANINTALNNNFLMTYTQLSASSDKTHQSLLPGVLPSMKMLINESTFSRLGLLSFQKENTNLTVNSKLLRDIILPVWAQGSYEIINYFTIKESLNSIYKVNYIVESQALNSKLMSELAFHSNQNSSDGVSRLPSLIEGANTMKRFENIQRDLVTTDSLTVSNFLNGTYSFVPSKTILLRSFNELIDSQINRSKIENENEYIQIDIWTNGELSPRQALLNAFRKLFELFYNLSKYNCLKPVEI